MELISVVYNIKKINAYSKGTDIVLFSVADHSYLKIREVTRWEVYYTSTKAYICI